jgi:NADPH-dependent curcumin reductase CurA
LFARINGVLIADKNLRTLAGSNDKVALALRHGYEHVVNHREQDFVSVVKELTPASDGPPSTTASAGIRGAVR